MHLFQKLRALRAFEKLHLDFLDTLEDHHLIGEIGYHQAKGSPVTLKQLFLLDVGSIATVQRRLRRLKQLGFVQQRRAPRDRRSVQLTLSPKCLRVFSKYDTLMTAKPPTQENGGPHHVCGLCDSDASRRKLLVTFLDHGVKRGDKCVLVAHTEVQNEVLAELHPRRRAPEQVVVSEGYDSSDGQFAFLKREAQEAKQAGRALCIAGDMTWIFSRDWRLDALLDFESRFDALAGRLPVKALCVYDSRRFSSDDFLQAAKCHRDHSRYPIMLG
jgi:DNA-binding MarR family transcriptional regulator